MFVGKDGLCGKEVFVQLCFCFVNFRITANAANTQHAWKDGGIAQPDPVYPGQFTRKQQVLQVETHDGQIFVDIPTTLSTLWSNVKQTHGSKTKAEQWDAYQGEAERFSSQLLADLNNTVTYTRIQNAEVPVAYQNYTVLIEYNGGIDAFYDAIMTILDTTLNFHGYRSSAL